MMRLLLIGLLWFLSAVAYSQESVRYFNYTTEQGFPTNTYEHICQDSYGFTWLASYDGLFRWDGHSFKKYQSNIAYTVFEDSQKRLWVGSLSGLNLYDRQNDQFLFRPLREGKSTIPVNAIVEDTSRNLWLGTSYGLCEYKPETGEEEWFSSGADVIFCMVIDAAQTIWMGTINGGLRQMSTLERKLRTLPFPEPQPGKPGFTKINSLLVGSDNKIWVGTENRGLLVINSRGEPVKEFSHFSVNAAGHPNLIRSLYEDANGTVWIGVIRDLVYFLPKGSSSPQPLTTAAQNNDNDQLFSITAVTEDAFGNTWFASNERGLFYTNKFKNRFSSHKSGTQPNQISGGISSFIELENNGIWIGTNGSGIYRWDLSQNAPFRLFNPVIHKDAVNDMKADGENIWIATWGNGIRLLDKTGRQLKHYYSQPQNSNGLINNDVKSILPDDSLVWIGTHGEGLAVLNKNSGHIEHHLNNKTYPFNLKSPAWINHLFKDSKKRLWISTYSGLFVFDGRKLQQFMHREDTTSIGNNAVNMVAEASDGKIWVVNEAGLDRYDESSGQFERISARLNLPPVMKSVKTDGDLLWISSNAGIIRLNSRTLQYTLFRVSDGLASDMYQRTTYVTRDGQIWTAGSKGFIQFQRSALVETVTPMPFYFSELVLHSDTGKILLSAKDTVVLSHRQAIFSVSFTSPDYYAPEDLRFRYMLEGVRNEWIDVADQRKLLFTNLPQGNYNLKIQVSHKDGQWVDAPKALHIHMLPPWWKTWWFNSALVLLAVGLVMVFFYWRLSSIKSRNRQLRSEVAKQTATLQENNEALLEQRDEILLQNETIEASNEELIRQTNRILEQQQQMVQHNATLVNTVDELQTLHQTKTHLYSVLAHDLKNPVLAQSELASYLLENLRQMNKAELETYLQSIQRSSAALHELLLNLLNWARTESGQLEPKPSVWNLSDMVVQNLALLNSQFKNKNIAVEVDLHTSHAINADRNMADAVFRNILSNACKFSPFNSIVEISSSVTDAQILLSVTDHGLGMTPLQQSKLFQLEKESWQTGTAGEKGMGLGLVVADNFMRANGGSILVSSSEGKGSIFTLSFPLATELEAPSEKNYKSRLQPSVPDILPELDRVRIHGKKILLVEDNQEVRDYLKLILSGLFEIFEASSGEKALNQMEETLPDIIITDLLMPGMDGLQFCREVKNKPGTSHIPILVLTSQTGGNLQQESYASGADIFLEKPVRYDILIQLIANHLLKQEKQREVIMDLVISEQPLPAIAAGLNRSDEEFLIRLVEFIEQTISDPLLDARMISKEMGVSRTVLYAKIKSLTGNTVHEFIKSIRLRKSVKLLLENRLSITQIAFEVGFSSRSYFDRCFVKQYKMAPREYINSNLPGKNKKR